jgi:hypothetical protein
VFSWALGYTDDVPEAGAPCDFDEVWQLKVSAARSIALIMTTALARSKEELEMMRRRLEKEVDSWYPRNDQRSGTRSRGKCPTAANDDGATRSRILERYLAVSWLIKLAHD